MKIRPMSYSTVAGAATAVGLYFWINHLASSMRGAKFTMPHSIILSAVLIAIVLAFVFRSTAVVARSFFAAPQALNAIIAYVGCYFLLILICALLYAQINSWEDGGAFNNRPTLLDLLYFSAVTASTLGYGDYAPQTGYVKTVSVLEATASIVLIGVYLGSVSTLLRQNTKEADSDIVKKTPPSEA